MDAEKTLNHLSVKANYKRIHLFILAMVVSTSSVALAVRPESDATWSYSGLLLAALAVSLLCLLTLWLYVIGALEESKPGGVHATRRSPGA